MFAKLLKHEMKATAGSIGLLSLAALGMGIIGGIMMRYMVGAIGEQRMESFGGILTIFSVFIFLGLMAYSLGGELFLGYQFYKRKFTDQGYLTFTLPAHSWQIFLSSLVNILIWSLIIMAVTAVSFISIFLIGFVGVPEIEEALSRINFSYEMEYLREDFDVVALIYGVVEFFTTTVTMMTCITLGSVLAKKHKIMASIGVYYVWTLIMGIISTQLFGGALLNSVEVDFSRVFLIEIALSLATAMGGFLLSCWLMDKKLILP